MVNMHELDDTFLSVENQKKNTGDVNELFFVFVNVFLYMIIYHSVLGITVFE